MSELLWDTQTVFADAVDLQPVTAAAVVAASAAIAKKIAFFIVNHPIKNLSQSFALTVAIL